MAKDVKVICPIMQGECVEDGAIRDGELVACNFWTNVQGQNPQTGEAVNQGGCAITWIPMLLIENTKVNRETGAAVESMRNKNVTTAEQITSAITQLNETNKRRITK